MKNIILCLCVSAAVLCCAASCGSHPVSNDGVKASVEIKRSKTDDELITEITGCWETTSEFVGGVKKDTEDMTYKRYEFLKDGTGFYYDADGGKQPVEWKITPDGGVDISCGDVCEKYEYVNYDLTVRTDTSGGEHVLNMGKVGSFSKPVEQ